MIFFVYMKINLIFGMKKPTNKPLLYIVGKNTKYLILILVKSFTDIMLEFDFFEAFNAHKSHKNVVILSSLLYQIIRKLTLTLFSLDSSFRFRFLQVSIPHILLLVNPFNFLQFCWLLLFTLWFFNKLCVRAEFYNSLCSFWEQYV